MVLSAHNLTIGYQAQSPVLQNLEFHLPESSLTCIIGDNGVGKSTLLKTITGSLKPISGDIIMQLTLPLPKPSNSAHIFSIVLTEPIPEPMISVHDLVSMGRMPYTGFFGRLSDADELIINQAMETMKISHLQDRYISETSDGQRQRALIAKAIAQQTPIMILDEPTAFLDYKSRIELMLLLRDLAANGKSILITTHDLDLVKKYADWIWAIEDGKITEGTTKDCEAFLP